MGKKVPVAEMKEACTETRVEDEVWLCSLSESELDLLICLKLLILQRAKMIGHEELAKKFDLKMLRAIGVVLMEHLKLQVKDSSLIPDVVKSSEFLDSCNLLKCDNGAVTTIEELSTNVGVDLQELWRRPRVLKRKKQKVKAEV
ncbi:hypothetical protein L6164_035372 [Bauhinia variegata]|uniref:Uncharacterized protein n=1 Tax=Bauhinia variegata TaxID=167791 RepID=A0ACB9KDR4_BAUVA|nr:hypothetical protein L6164_035372 [Bauhinia variegata]